MKKRNLVLTSICLLITIFPIVMVSAAKPPLPPALNVLVNTGFADELEPWRATLLERFQRDMPRCGFRLNFEIINYPDMVNRVISGDFEIVFFSGLAILDDSFPSILVTLNLLNQTLNYDNLLFHQKLSALQLASDNNQIEEATMIFHEIEAIMYEEQLFPIFGYSYDPYSVYQYSTSGFIINCKIASPLYDKNLRRALSYLVNRELYTYVTNSDDFVMSHVFEWSQYHDDSLPSITYSIGKAKSTLAQAGYRPQAIH